MRPVLTLETPPSALPIDLSDIKGHLRIEHTDDDQQLAAYLSAAVGLLDGPQGRLGRALFTQTWRQSQRCPNGADAIWIDLPPVQSLESVEFYDSDHVLQTATLADFELLKQPDGFAVVRPKLNKSWPDYASGREDALQVTFVAGETAQNMPEPIKLAIRLLVGEFTLNREASSEHRLRQIPIGVDALLEPYRARWIA